jgi:hypothetical protein
MPIDGDITLPLLPSAGSASRPQSIYGISWCNAHCCSSC